MNKLLPLLTLLLCCLTSLVLAEPAPAPAPKNVTVDETEKLLKANPEIVIIDVRTPDEFKAGHIAGAKNIDFHGDNFEKEISSLDKSKTYVVHCAAGGRSAQACKVIEKVNLPTVYHMNQGFKAWEKAGKPVEK
jgi:rhodanese-related sulfurtransferase